jgi:hypothetical protein
MKKPVCIYSVLAVQGVSTPACLKPTTTTPSTFYFYFYIPFNNDCGGGDG